MTAVRCIVETPRDARSPGVPPVHLGFVPGTLTMRREPVGALIVSDEELLPGSGVEAEEVGVLRTARGGDRLVCAQPGSELSPDLRAEVERLYADEGAAEWLPALEAEILVSSGRIRFTAATIGPEG
jgi:inorganic pyrophosphatase